MNEISITKIEECIAYTAEYDVSGVNDFFDVETGGNILYDLQYLMEDENPDVHVPDIPDDYNFFEYPYGENPDGTVHICYFDMVDCKGKDNKDGAYRFVTVPAVEAACMMYQGPNETIGKGYDIVCRWIKENGYEIAGPARISAIHGPWDREDPEEYVSEVQIPVRKAE